MLQGGSVLGGVGQTILCIKCCRCQKTKSIDPLLYDKRSLCIFESLWGRSLGATYAVHLRLIRKPIVDFLSVIIEFFSLGAIAQALWVNIDWKSLFLKEGGSLWPKISGRRGRPPLTICAWLDRPVNALQLCCWKFSHKERTTDLEMAPLRPAYHWQSSQPVATVTAQLYPWEWRTLLNIKFQCSARLDYEHYTICTTCTICMQYE